MLNLTLFKKEIKFNYILLLIFIGVLSMYASMIVAMFDPKLGDSLKDMAASMPELFAAFGMLDVGTTLLDFVVSYLYGMLFIAFPSVFIIILSNRLIARYVDQGSMVYLLATPNKRLKIAATQAIFLVTCIFVIVAYVTLLIIIIGNSMFPNELDVAAFLRVNAGLFGLLVFLGGICFFSSCIFNDAKISNSVGAGVVILSLLIQMISRVGEKFENLKYATPLTLFNADGLAAGDSQAYLTCVILYLVGSAFIAAGIACFNRRNLPI